MKFRKKPVIVEAYQITMGVLEDALFHGCPYPIGLSLSSASHNEGSKTINSWFGRVTTIHGQETQVVEGDWIISEGDGIHFYPCKPEIFAQTYESAE